MKKFQRKIEDFVCKNCGTGVKGDGYTNHCPKCLWSRYVDVNPGDREEKRGGTMKPTGIFLESAENTIVHICVKCG
ncbi:RNHCP domain-containing protein, partial [Patescibacteria group bacterium]|nr:RNHCP domain-containing protein [Patescibacteria group bacterium]